MILPTGRVYLEFSRPSHTQDRSIFFESVSRIYAEVRKSLNFGMIPWVPHTVSPSSANFPLIAITLRENLMSLFQERTLGTSTAVEGDCGVDAPSRASGKRYYYGLAALIPPVLIAFFTEDVALLVGITGAYAGLGIQVGSSVSNVLCRI